MFISNVSHGKDKILTINHGCIYIIYIYQLKLLVFFYTFDSPRITNGMCKVLSNSCFYKVSKFILLSSYHIEAITWYVNKRYRFPYFNLVILIINLFSFFVGILATVEILAKTQLNESQRTLLSAIESCGTNLISVN